MRALVRILPGPIFFHLFFTASDAGKADYIHQHSMGDAPYIGSSIIYKSLSDIHYDIIVGILINVCDLKFSALPHI